MRKLIAIILLLLIVGRVEGQDLAVKYFTLVPSDLSVQIQPRKDLNGKNCALVKVGIGLQGVQFEGNIMGEIANKVGDIYATRLSYAESKTSKLFPNYGDICEFWH